MMPKTTLRFIGNLFLWLTLVFTIHLLTLYFLKKTLFENLLIYAYWSNFLLAAIIFWIIDRYKTRQKNALGFMFMAGSFLKFAVFFIIFYPVYKADGDVVADEFATFFIPYVCCLIYETYSTSKILNQL